MNRILSFLFPVLMTAGLVVSLFVVASALQAASLPAVPSMTVPARANANASELVAQGRALFLAKGCIVCHRRDELGAMRAAMLDFDFEDVPNLTNLKMDPEYLRRWLHNPKALKPMTAMPNLNLSDTEIEGLVAFLTNPSK